MKSKKKYNSKMMNFNINSSNKASQTSLHKYSRGNYDMRSEMFSRKKKKLRENRSMEIKHLPLKNSSSLGNEEITATYKYLLNNNNNGYKVYTRINSAYNI